MVRFLIFATTFLLGLCLVVISEKLTFLREQVVSISYSASVIQPSHSINKDVASEISNPEPENANRFTPLGVKSDSEVVDFYLKFQMAVQRDDKKTVAGMMLYPLRVNLPSDNIGKNYRIIRSPKSFVKMYDQIFDRKLKNFITQIDANSRTDIWALYSGIAVGRGVIWIDVACNDAFCENGDYTLAIRTIHGRSGFIDQ